MVRRSLCVFLLLPFAACAVTPERLDRQARAYLELNRFNGTVLVAQDGKVLLSQGYGMANHEWSIPNTPETKFRLGSITKQFTGMAILLLEQDGKLKVDDPVSKYLDHAPERWSGITIHHLLTHTSGIPNFTSFPDYVKTMMIASPPVESLKRVYDKPLDFDPGTKWSYSNSGYVLLGLIIEKASGTSYASFMQQRIFGPLGMSDTGYDSDRTILPKRAAGYERGPAGLRNAAFIDMTIPHAAGALYSTTLDLMRWDAALSEGKLLTAENYKRYFTPVKNDYAYGWGVAAKEGVTSQSHGGGINGFATMIIRVPEQKLLVVTLSNVVPSQAGRLAQDLQQLAMGKELPVPAARKEIQVPVETLREYTGEYELRPGFSMMITVEGGQLVTQATGQGKIPVYAETPVRFFPKVMDATIEFQKDSVGKVTSLVLEQNGNKMVGNRK